jgi:3-phenylpropionate/trans-cinnamate dioxygenase ferredoxin subunit
VKVHAVSHDVPVGSVDELPPGSRKLAWVTGRSIVLFNIDGAIVAIENSCPHNGAAIGSGQLEGPILRCPAHGLRFNLTTGCMVGASAGGLCLNRLPVDVRDGRLVLTVDEATAPGTVSG